MDSLKFVADSSGCMNSSCGSSRNLVMAAFERALDRAVKRRGEWSGPVGVSRDDQEAGVGPLSGVKVIEIAGIGPGPFCGMVLSDLGADVLRVDRADKVVTPIPAQPGLDLLARGRRSVGADLKSADGVETVLRLIESGDALIEGFR